MSRFWNGMMRAIDGLNSQEWGLILAAMIVVGLICLRGFGSRSQY